MGEIVNLRRARKQKQRADRELAAAENRVRFGRTKVEKNFEARRQNRTDSFLENNRLDGLGPSRDEPD